MNLFPLAIFLLIASGGQGAREEARITDPDFEAPTLEWGRWPQESQSQLELDPLVARHGRQSLRVTARFAGDRIFALATGAGFEPGIVYRISVAVRKDVSVPDSSVSFFINYRSEADGSIQERGYPVQLRRTPEGAGWVRWSGLFMTPRQPLRVQFLLGVEHAVGRVWFDDIRVERLGKASDLKADVWTNLTLGVEIGAEPLKRFAKHKASEDIVYRMARRYNALLFDSAFAERDLRDLERCRAYAGKAGQTPARALFVEAEQQLNQTYLAYGAAFESGKEEAWKAFETEATTLESTLQRLRAAITKEMAGLRPVRVPALPPHLGRQSRLIRPLEPNGRMNRLLFGVWSPTDFAEFEQPFEFEFHASVPTAPKVHTETVVDFSNLTEACDRLEALGYPSTFAYLLFGIHQYLYAPDWFVEKHRHEPDFYMVSRDGRKGGDRGTERCLNYFHPAVRAYIQDYLGQYATYCKNEPRILFYETSQEAYPYFTADGQMRESGYGPHAEQAFRAYLRRRYGDIAALNRAWNTHYTDFDAIQPPPDCYETPNRELTPLVAEFEAFRDDAYIGYLKLIRDSLKAGDPTKPVVARHSTLLQHINGARLFETCDILSYHRGAPLMQLMNVYLNSLSRYNTGGLGYMEDFWGMQDDRVSDEVIQRRSLEKHIAQLCIWGRTLQMNWYSYTTGSYIFQYNGNWMNPRYDITTMRYCAPALAIAKRKMENLDWVLTHSHIVPSRVLVWQPSASMRNERPRTNVFGEILGWHTLLMAHGFLYEIVPEEYFADGRARLSDFDVVILPQARCLSPNLQEKLANFVQLGGTLVACGKPGVLDEIARPSGVLLGLLQQRMPSQAWSRVEKALAEARQGEPNPSREELVVARCGRGQLVGMAGVASLTAEKGRPALVRLLGRAARRFAWAQESRFEVVPRVADDGGCYLFVLNTDLDQAAQDVVRVAHPVREAVDVSLPGGYLVPVKAVSGGAAMRVRLGPGECAVLSLGRVGG